MVTVEKSLPAVQDDRQHLSGAFGFPFSDLGREHGDEVPHLGLGEPDVQRGAEVELELTPRASHAGQGRVGREFPAPVVEDVAGEDVREQVLFQERVDDGREQLVTGGCQYHFLPGERRAHSCAVLVPVRAGGQWCGVSAHFILDAPRLPLVHHGHEGLDAAQAAREPCVRVHLNQNLLDLVHGQSRLKPFGKGRPQPLLIARGGEGCDGNDAALLRTQSVCCVHGSRPRIVLRVGDLLHPLDDFVVDAVREGDVRHGGVG